jgi:hypothetical protein
MGRDKFWVSSLEGWVYEVNLTQAVEKGSFEAGVVKQFSGQYYSLAFSDGYLWGLDPEAQRLCKIRVQQDQ